MNQGLAVLGCGNMAQALVGGMYASNPSLQVLTYTPSRTRAEELAQKTQGKVLDHLDTLPCSQYLMLACKPQQFKDLAQEIKGKISSETIVLSILAGVNVESLQKNLGHEKVVRIMPNTPALVGAGVNAFYFSKAILSAEKKETLKLFESFSEVFDFPQEEQVDTITPYSGSGPAYFFELTRILIDDLVSRGINAADAERMLKATAFGAGKLLVESKDSAETLRNKVTSKGGVTYEALKVFQDNGLGKITHLAIEAALKRNQELSKG